MKRLVLLLAASMLGSGCIVSHDTCDSHTVLVRWPTFTRVAEAGYETTGACYADFAAMQVYVDGAVTPAEAACLDNEIPFTLLTGNHTVTVEAVDGAGYPLVRDTVSFGVSDGCGDQVVNANPGESWVTLDYTVPGNTCISPSFMWFRVDDLIGNYSFHQDEQTAGAHQADYPCGPFASSRLVPLALAVPEGDFVLQRLEEVTFPTSDTYVVESGFCTPLAFQAVSGVDEIVTPIALADGLACRRP